MSTAEEIYHTLIAPVEERMMRSVARLMRDPDEAADVFQTVLVQVWRDLKKIHRHPCPQAYLLRLCISASYDALRRRARRRRHEVALEPRENRLAASRGDEPTAQLVAREQHEALLAAIAELPPGQAQALLLRTMDDLPFETIARTLGCREATARSHVSKARQRLRELLSRPRSAAHAAHRGDLFQPAQVAPMGLWG